MLPLVAMRVLRGSTAVAPKQLRRWSSTSISPKHQSSTAEAARVVYVNGDYVPEADAKISIFDRGFLMGDAVYEVTAVVQGKLLDFDSHIARLRRSLDELSMSSPCSDSELLDIHRALIAHNHLDEGLVYLQASRGACDRDFLIPDAVDPSLVLFTQTKPMVQTAAAAAGLRVISLDDIRWQRRDIKTVQLLARSRGSHTAHVCAHAHARRALD